MILRIYIYVYNIYIYIRILGLTQGSGYIHNIDNTSEMITTRKVGIEWHEGCRISLEEHETETRLSHMLHGAGIFTNIYPINDPVM